MLLVLALLRLGLYLESLHRSDGIPTYWDVSIASFNLIRLGLANIDHLYEYRCRLLIRLIQINLLAKIMVYLLLSEGPSGPDCSRKTLKISDGPRDALGAIVDYLALTHHTTYFATTLKHAEIEWRRRLGLHQPGAIGSRKLMTDSPNDLLRWVKGQKWRLVILMVVLMVILADLVQLV